MLMAVGREKVAGKVVVVVVILQFGHALVHFIMRVMRLRVK